ncbi:MAG: ANTAR domain-containing protein [Solirubrobacteraceae bacterium]|nr:ANTAR domain-containing protein [Solirubrobacteraceae bacterium]
MTPSRFRITLADEDRDALAVLAARLEGLGHDVTGMAISVTEGVQDIIETDPELTIVMLHESDEHALDLIEELGAELDGPMVVLLEDPSATFLAAAADRGISAFASSPDDEELQGVLEVAVRLHGHRAELEARVDTLTRALGGRAALEQAKGVLMERHGLTAEAAEARLHERARETGRRVIESAEDVTGTAGD